MNENPQRISRNLSMHFIEKMVRATKRQSLKLAGVRFWIDRDGPFANQLSYSLPVEKWNTDKFSSAFIKKLTPDMEQEYIELYRARC